MATDAEQLTQLKTIQRSGVKRVTTGKDTSTVEYRDLSEIEAARADLESEINTSAGSYPLRRVAIHVVRGF